MKIQSVSAVNTLKFTSNVQNNRNIYFGNSEIEQDTYNKQDNNMKYNCGLSKDKLKGEIGNTTFDLKLSSPLTSTKMKLKGTINDKETEISYKQNFFTSNRITGFIGDKQVDLKYSYGLFTDRLKGTFDGKPVNLKIVENLASYSFKNEGTNLKIKQGMFNNNAYATGKYSEDPDLLPVLISIVNRQQLEDMVTVALII